MDSYYLFHTYFTEIIVDGQHLNWNSVTQSSGGDILVEANGNKLNLKTVTINVGQDSAVYIMFIDW